MHNATLVYDEYTLVAQLFSEQVGCFGLLAAYYWSHGEDVSGGCRDVGHTGRVKGVAVFPTKRKRES